MAKQIRHKSLLVALAVVASLFLTVALVMLFYLINVSQKYSQALSNIQRINTQNQVIADTYIKSLEKNSHLNRICQSGLIIDELNKYQNLYIQQEAISPTIMNCRIFENKDQSIDTDIISVIIKSHDNQKSAQGFFDKYAYDRMLRSKEGVLASEDGMEKILLNDSEFISLKRYEDNDRTKQLFDQLSELLSIKQG